MKKMKTTILRQSNSSEYTLDEIFEMAKSKKFPPKRIFYFGNKKKAYTPITHFFTTTNKFSNRPANMKCKVQCCNSDVYIKLDPKADFSNANKHLFVHQSTKEWYNAYSRNSNQSQEFVINQETYNLVCFFITSKTAFNQMKNPFFTKICDPKIKIKSHFTFRYKIIPFLWNACLKKSNASLTKLFTLLWLLTVG